MLGALFGLIMLGVGWLVIWSCVDHSKPSETWWPFAMRIDRAGYDPRGRAAATEHAMASKREPFATVATVRRPMTLSLTLETRSTITRS